MGGAARIPLTSSCLVHDFYQKKSNGVVLLQNVMKKRFSNPPRYYKNYLPMHQVVVTYSINIGNLQSLGRIVFSDENRKKPWKLTYDWVRFLALTGLLMAINWIRHHGGWSFWVWPSFSTSNPATHPFTKTGGHQFCWVLDTGFTW